MDLGITTKTTQTEDRTWLADAQNHVQQTYTLDPSTGFVLATHYPNGYLRSGQGVAYDTATDRLVPWDPGATEGNDETFLEGVLYDSVQVTEALAGGRDVAVPVMVWGFISLSKLPPNSGFDAVLADARTEAAVGNANQLWIGA
jgi:hypothetical protein